MMKSIGAVLPLLGKSGEGAQPGEGRDAAQRVVDVFTRLVDKPARSGKPEKTADTKGAAIKIVLLEKRAEAPPPGLPSDLILAAALPRTDHPEPARNAKPSRKPAKADGDVAESRVAASLAVETSMPVVQRLAKDQQNAPLAEPHQSDEREPDAIARNPVQRIVSAELPDKVEEPRLSTSSGLVFAKQETHFDTSRLGLTMSASTLFTPAQLEADTLPQPRVTTTALNLDATKSNEPLKSLKIEIDPGTDQNAVTATLKLRHDQLEVRLETVDGDMAARLKDAASSLTQSLEQGGYRVETVVVQKGSATDNAAFLQSMATQEKPGRSRSRTGREGRMGDERANGPRRARTGGDIIV
jgi:hypothetical protein